MTLETELINAGQAHLIQHLSKLDGAGRARLIKQLEEVDLAQLSKLTAGQDDSPDWAALARRAKEPPAVRLGQQHAVFTVAQALEAGEKALRAGQVGVILVAGGQGTRLGFDYPKGMFIIGPISGRSLFQMHVDRLLAVMQRYRISIPLYLMTSPATDAQTREYFAKTARCGLKEDQLNIFCQGVMPAVEATSGRLLLSEPDELVLSPDGHGGLVSALQKNGCLADAKRRGIKYFYYAQVDNPLAQLADPILIGYHILSGSQMTTQVVQKRFAKERVGNVVEVDGKVQIIEYSDLPDSAAEATNADGSLKFWAGNIAIHLFDREFIESVTSSADGLPFHRALKAIPCLEDGKLIKPDKPNGIKFERFVFDLLPLAKCPIVVEAAATEVFAPVKNADGAAVDTPALAKAAISNLHRSWLEQAGVEVAPKACVEIHPSWALDAAEVAKKVGVNSKIEKDTYLH